jgi:predicted alpha/beta hydrolase family esterase
LIAHSFGCLASVVAASRLPERVAGALFVAPACPEKFGITARIPIAPLTFPAVLAASRNDPWMKYLSAVVWADRWGARLVDLGAAGHVNVDSGHGAWPEGLALFRDLQRSLESWILRMVAARIIDGASAGACRGCVKTVETQSASGIGQEPLRP